MGKDVIVACDFADGNETMRFLKSFGKEKPFVKIGMELFYAEGEAILRELKKRGHKIFLDLKLHDIPNTVKKTMAVLSEYDIDMVNIHAAGGSRMMAAALEGLNEKHGVRPILIAVTQLTSTSREMLKNELLISEEMGDVVTLYAENAARSGVDGVVCSPLEVKNIKAVCGENFLTVTPGIRFPGGEKGDQVRVTSPAEAKAEGSDYIVVGRPITAAENPVSAYERCCVEFLG